MDLNKFVDKLSSDLKFVQIPYRNICAHKTRNIASMLAKALLKSNGKHNNYDEYTPPRTVSAIVEIVPIELLQSTYQLTDTELYDFTIIPCHFSKFTYIHSIIKCLLPDLNLSLCLETAERTITEIQRDLVKYVSTKPLPIIFQKQKSKIIKQLSDPYNAPWDFLSFYFSVNILVIDTNYKTLLYPNSGIPDPKNPLIIIHENNRCVYSPVKVNNKYALSYSQSEVVKKIIKYHTENTITTN